MTRWKNFYLCVLALSLGLCGEFSYGVEANGTYQFTVTNGTKGEVISAPKNTTTFLAQFANGTTSLNFGNWSSLGNVSAVPGSTATFNATGTSADTTVCATNISWYGSFSSDSVNGSGNFTGTLTNSGVATHFTVPSNCGGDHHCNFYYSTVSTSASIPGSFPNNIQTGNSLTLTHAGTTNYAFGYLVDLNTMNQPVATSNNLLEIEWTTGGSITLTDLSGCYST